MISIDNFIYNFKGPHETDDVAWDRWKIKMSREGVYAEDAFIALTAFYLKHDMSMVWGSYRKSER